MREVRFAVGMLLSVLCGGILAPGWAGEQVGPEHGKLNTADASPNSTGHYEFDLVYNPSWRNHAYNQDGDCHRVPSRQQHTVVGYFAAGILSHVELNISSTYESIRDNAFDFDPHDGVDRPHGGQGLGDTTVGLRWQFLDDKASSLQVAWATSLTMPTGRESTLDHIGTTGGYWNWTNALLVSKDWDRWTANGQLGYTLPFGEKRGDDRGTLVTNVAAGYQVLKVLQPEIELNYAHGFSRGPGAASDSLAATAGLVMPVDRFRIMLGVQQVFWGRNTSQSTAGKLAFKVAF